MTTKADFQWAFQMIRDAGDALLELSERYDDEPETDDWDWLSLSDDSDEMLAAQHILEMLIQFTIQPDNSTEEIQFQGRTLGQFRQAIRDFDNHSDPNKWELPISDFCFSLDLLDLNIEGGLRDTRIIS